MVRKNSNGNKEICINLRYVYMSTYQLQGIIVPRRGGACDP